MLFSTKCVFWQDAEKAPFRLRCRHEVEKVDSFVKDALLPTHSHINQKTVLWDHRWVRETVRSSLLWVYATSANTPLGPKIGDLKTLPSNYDQTVADGATLWIDRRCVVLSPNSLPRCAHTSCKCTKMFSGFALCLSAKKLVRHIGGLF